VEVLARCPLPLSHVKLVQRIVDFDRLDAAGPLRAHGVFCCLGTTIGQAGSQAAFRRVDHDYPLELARRAKVAGVKQFVLVSALGANARSWLFYNRVKGETERDIAALGLTSAVFLRPSLLLGARSDKRRGEAVAAVAGRLLAPLLVGGLRKYRPIPADAVAAAMIEVALRALPSQVMESDEIARLAQESERLPD